jgi:hypothetical protein
MYRRTESAALSTSTTSPAQRPPFSSMKVPQWRLAKMALRLKSSAGRKTWPTSIHRFDYPNGLNEKSDHSRLALQL